MVGLCLDDGLFKSLTHMVDTVYMWLVLVVDCLILMISMVYNSGSCRSRMDMFGIFVYLRYTLAIWLFIIPKCKTHME